MIGATGWQSEREAAVQAARQAGRILLDWSGRFSVRKKGVNDVVTEADNEAQDAIRKLLLRRFPEDDFLGEEGPAAPPTSARRRWIVDPLDGTTNYVHGLPFFCTSIGLEADGRLVVGVVFDPIRNECFSAADGAGADCNGAVIQVSATDDLADSLLCAGLPPAMGNDRRPIEVFADLTCRAYAMRRLGSAALALAYVAAGRAEAFYAHDLKPWDAAGGAVLVRAAGGRATHFDDSPYLARRPDVLATNGLVHRRLADVITGAG